MKIKKKHISVNSSLFDLYKELTKIFDSIEIGKENVRIKGTKACLDANAQCILYITLLCIISHRIDKDLKNSIIEDIYDILNCNEV